MTIVLTVFDGGGESLLDLMAGLHVIAGVHILAVPVLPELEPAQLVDVPLVEAVDRNVAEQTGSSV